MDIFFDKYNGGTWPANKIWPNYVTTEGNADFIITSMVANFNADFKIPRAGRRK